MKSTKSLIHHTAIQQLAITIKDHLQAIRHLKYATKTAATTTTTTECTDLCHQSQTGTLIGRTNST
eukprot:scaffold7278_cov139-Skeletonema_dohrnii-CCMP3373.AAC.1